MGNCCKKKHDNNPSYTPPEPVELYQAKHPYNLIPTERKIIRYIYNKREWIPIEIKNE